MQDVAMERGECIYSNIVVLIICPIDLVFVDFIESQLLEILNSLQKDRVYTESDVATYSPILANAALGLYAQQAWSS